MPKFRILYGGMIHLIIKKGNMTPKVQGMKGNCAIQGIRLFLEICKTRYYVIHSLGYAILTKVAYATFPGATVSNAIVAYATVDAWTIQPQK